MPKFMRPTVHFLERVGRVYLQLLMTSAARRVASGVRRLGGLVPRPHHRDGGAVTGERIDWPQLRRALQPHRQPAGAQWQQRTEAALPA